MLYELIYGVGGYTILTIFALMVLGILLYLGTQ